MLEGWNGACRAIPNQSLIVYGTPNTRSRRAFVMPAATRRVGTVCANRSAHPFRRRARRTNCLPAPPKGRQTQPGRELQWPATFSLDRIPSRCQSSVRLPGPPTQARTKANVVKVRPVPVAENAAALPLAHGISVAPLMPQIIGSPNMNDTAGREAQPRQNLPPLPPAAQWAAGEVGARQLSTAVFPGPFASAGCSLDPTTTVNTSPDISCP